MITLEHHLRKFSPQGRKLTKHPTQIHLYIHTYIYTNATTSQTHPHTHNDMIMAYNYNYNNTNISGTSFGSEDSSPPTCDFGHVEGGFEPSDFLQTDDWLESFQPEEFSSFSKLLNYMPNELEVDSSRKSNGGFSEGTMISSK